MLFTVTDAKKPFRHSLERAVLHEPSLYPIPPGYRALPEYEWCFILFHPYGFRTSASVEFKSFPYHFTVTPVVQSVELRSIDDFSDGNIFWILEGAQDNKPMSYISVINKYDDPVLIAMTWLAKSPVPQQPPPTLKPIGRIYAFLKRFVSTFSSGK